MTSKKSDWENHASNSLIIPIYRNEENISELLEALSVLHGNLLGDLEVIFVFDGSPDQSRKLIDVSRHTVPFKHLIVEHSRNFGSFAAIVTGMRHSSGNYLAVMSADLQEPIGLIEEFFHTLHTSDVDIVVGSRQSRSDGWAPNLASNTFWFLFRKIIQPEIPRGGVDVFGCSRQVAQIIQGMQEANTSLIGLLYWIGFRRREIPYIRKPRAKGASAWNFRRRLKYLTDSLFSFTTLPITIISWLGIIGTTVAFSLGVFVFVNWLYGNIEQPGYTAFILVQLASTAAILTAIGVIGTYVWRTYDNSKRRPNAIELEKGRND